ncbi:hypothetical protein GGF46_000964 [Coemansia sp. RSA 552]|nr:hypothetical protein GGF46_000964 [Coemansia sp. RSA 552]
MHVEELSEQRLLIDSAVDNLSHPGDAQTCRDIGTAIEQTRQSRRRQTDAQQEQLQQLARRLQAARSRVEASKSKREAKSHADVMRDLGTERQQTEHDVSEHDHRQGQLREDIDRLQRQVDTLDENVQGQVVPDEAVLKLHILRSLGVEPLASAQTGLVERARVWTPGNASVVEVRGQDITPHQLAAQLWALCS